jgi:hypothetical protein
MRSEIGQNLPLTYRINPYISSLLDRLEFSVNNCAYCVDQGRFHVWSHLPHRFNSFEYRFTVN